MQRGHLELHKLGVVVEFVYTPFVQLFNVRDPVWGSVVLWAECTIVLWTPRHGLGECWGDGGGSEQNVT